MHKRLFITAALQVRKKIGVCFITSTIVIYCRFKGNVKINYLTSSSINSKEVEISTSTMPVYIDKFDRKRIYMYRYICSKLRYKSTTNFG